MTSELVHRRQEDGVGCPTCKATEVYYTQFLDMVRLYSTDPAMEAKYVEYVRRSKVCPAGN